MVMVYDEAGEGTNTIDPEITRKVNRFMKRKKDTNKIKPLTLDINKDLWKEFKMGTSREKSLNKAVIDLIEKEVERRKLKGEQ